MNSRYILFLFLIGITMLSTSNKPFETMLPIEDIESNVKDKIPFIGSWSREFSMGEGVDQKVTYTISAKEIKYNMAGSMPMEYAITMEKFISKDNRWIGKNGNTIYVIFVKDITENSISLFKKKVESMDEATTMKFPSDTERSQFTSWNIYKNVK